MPGEDREIVAILFSDVVGFAHISDPEKTVSIVHDEETRNLVRALTKQHDGDWVREIGDSVVCIFGSAVAATQCALEIQEGIAQGYQFRPRIGIQVVDLEFRAADTDTHTGLFADAVNVAARVQALCEQGGICITGRVHEELRSNQALLDLEDLGETRLENVDVPVQVYRIALPMKSVELSEFPSARKRAEAKRSRAPTIAISVAVLLALTVGWLLVRSTPEGTLQTADAERIADAAEADGVAGVSPDSAALQAVSEEEVRAAAFEAVREKLRGLEGNSDFAARVWTIPDPVKDDTFYRVGIDAGCGCTALLFSIDGSADEISLLYPNPFHTDGSIRAGQVLKIPSSDEFFLRAIGGEGIDEMKLIVVEGVLEPLTSPGEAWNVTPEQTERVAELETFLATIETLAWDSATAPLQIIP